MPARPRFEVDGDISHPLAPAILVDPEQYEATEERFSASLEDATASARRFIPDEEAVTVSAEEPAQSVLHPEPKPELTQQTAEPRADQMAISAAAREVKIKETDRPLPRAQIPDIGGMGQHAGSACHEMDPPLDGNSNGWKQEVAARLNSYRARRRPRPPKYPSLSLNFEPPRPPAPSPRTCSPDLRSALAMDERQNTALENAPGPEQPAEQPVPPMASARVIEFPRFFTPQEPSPNQLAEPVCETPRILDAPEVELPAPALGGIVLETAAEEPDIGGRPGFEVPLSSASLSRRVLAAAVDGLVIALAEFVFGYIFLKIAKTIPALPQLLAAAGVIVIVLWAGYQYLLLTYSGATPGLRMSKLHLAGFDGSAVPRSTRRWRALASILSGLSLGLGFAWCFLDEDGLCWHDRITRTHLIPFVSTLEDNSGSGSGKEATSLQTSGAN